VGITSARKQKTYKIYREHNIKVMSRILVCFSIVIGENSITKADNIIGLCHFLLKQWGLKTNSYNGCNDYNSTH